MGIKLHWSGRKVLVTGAGGFIGSHLAERLVEAGADVTAFVHYRHDGSAGWLDRSRFKANMEIRAGDIRDADSLLSVIPARKFDYIFHLAALISVPYSKITPQGFIKTNLLGTMNILELEVNEKIIITSSSEVYGGRAKQKVCHCMIGDNESCPHGNKVVGGVYIQSAIAKMDEEHPLKAKSPYAASKIAGDALASAYYAGYGAPVVTVRPFNTFGPRQSTRAMVPNFIMQAMKGEVRYGNPDSLRDLTYVDDIVVGFLAAAELGEFGETYVLGTGYSHSVAQVATDIAGMVATMLEVTNEGKYGSIHDTLLDRGETWEVAYLCADATKAKKQLGWGPYVSYWDGLERTYNWFKENDGLYWPSVTI